MPNANYKAGVRAEYRTMKMLDAKGYITLRTAGSHGAFDVIAIGPHDTLCIQVKRGRPAAISPLEEERLRELKVPEGVYKQVWLWDHGKGYPVVKEYR